MPALAWQSCMTAGIISCKFILTGLHASMGVTAVRHTPPALQEPSRIGLHTAWQVPKAAKMEDGKSFPLIFWLNSPQSLSISLCCTHFMMPIELNCTTRALLTPPPRHADPRRSIRARACWYMARASTRREFLRTFDDLTYLPASRPRFKFMAMKQV
eukprot:8026-Pelagomonas_calceolata.AAC.3